MKGYESFLVSVIVFASLIIIFGLWHRWSRRAPTPGSERISESINEAAEVAQRRHVQRFGRASTDLQQTMNGHVSKHLTPAAKS